MKAIKLLTPLLLLLLTISVVSCNKDEDDGLNPYPPVLPVPSYETTFNVTLGYTNKITDINSNHILVDIDYGIADVNTLVYVVHRKSDGRYLKLHIMDNSSLKDITADNIAAVKDTLPEGKYYITFIATKNFKIDGVNVLTLLQSLTQRYNDAIMQIPNDFVHYATTEFEVSAIKGVNKPVALILKKMTTDLIFEFADANKIPNPYNFRLTVGVENIPSAFFIATGKTLTAKETEEKELFLYSGEKDVTLLTNEGQNAVVTIFHSLANDNLPASERGNYRFEFKENANGGNPIKVISEKLDSFSSELSSSMYVYALYEEGQSNP